MSHKGDWIPDATDVGYIAALGTPLHPALLAIEAAAKPLGISIVDRERPCSHGAAAPTPDRRVRTAYGFSTL
jgi:hypothetical protein